MKKGFLGLAVAMALGLILSQGLARAYEIDYGVIGGANIEFLGSNDTFFFNDGTGGKDFQITGGTGLLAPLSTIGLQGHIGGTFTIGTITINGSQQSAPVTGTGSFQIFEGASPTFQASLQWINIFTLGATGGLNFNASANLTGVTYSGSNPDLMKFPLGGINVLTFQFTNPSLSLTDLTADSADNKTSYSGSLSPVPEPATLLLLGCGLMGLCGLRKRIRK